MFQVKFEMTIFAQAILGFECIFLNMLLQTTLGLKLKIASRFKTKVVVGVDDFIYITLKFIFLNKRGNF